MSTSSANRKTVSSNHNLHQVQQMHKRRRISKSIPTDTNEQAVIHTNLQNHLQAPIFNIHIHVPPYEGDDFKKYLPKIQPVIHLHFDELARKMELNSQANYSILQNLLQTTYPKFGDVKFHYANKTKENDVTESGVDMSIPCCSTNYIDSDTEAESCLVTENNDNSIPENEDIIESYGRTNSSSNFRINPKSNMKDRLISELDNNLKLKEAVVVLTDICKTNYYKNMVAVNNNGMCQNSKNNEKEKSFDVSNKKRKKSKERSRVVVNEELVKKTIKQEEESSSVESPDCGRGTEINYEDHIKNGTLYTVGERIVSNSLDDNTTPCPDKTLIALAEGCNFSTVLSWFRFPKTESLYNRSVEGFSSTRKNCTSESFGKNEEGNNEFCNPIKESQYITRASFSKNGKMERESDGVESELDIDVENDLKMNITNYKFEDIRSVLPPNKSDGSDSDPDYSGIATEKQSSSRSHIRVKDRNGFVEK